MKKIKTYENWCNIDQLDGEDIKDKEKLEITWPDKSVSIEKLIVEKWEETEYDMGKPCPIPYSKAYIQINYNGLKTKVSAVGLKAKRILK